jgi:hypothetical protein
MRQETISHVVLASCVLLLAAASAAVHAKEGSASQDTTAGQKPVSKRIARGEYLV